MSRYSRPTWHLGTDQYGSSSRPPPISAKPPPAPMRESRRSHSGPNASVASFYTASTSDKDAGYSRSSSSRWSSRCSTPTRPSTPTYQTSDSRNSSRSRSPTPTNLYSEMLIKASQRQRQRSIPPPPPPLEKVEPAVVPPGAFGKGKPPPSPRVVNSDFYRGSVKSIYEREPLFQDFTRSVAHKGYNMYNSVHLQQMKTEFKEMVEDKFDRRMVKSDPTVEREFGRKLYPWRNVKASDTERASERLAEAHAERKRREITPVNKPRLFLYHRSTQDLPPPSHIYIR